MDIFGPKTKMSKTKRTDTPKVSTQADASSHVSETPSVTISVKALVVAARISSVINTRFEQVEAGTGQVAKAWILVALLNELANVDVTYKGCDRPKKREIVDAWLRGLTARELTRYLACLQDYQSKWENILHDQAEPKPVTEEVFTLKQLVSLCHHYGKEDLVEDIAKCWSNSRLYAVQSLTYRDAESDPLRSFDQSFVAGIELFDTIAGQVEAHLESLSAEGKDPGRVQVYQHERGER